MTEIRELRSVLEAIAGGAATKAVFAFLAAAFHWTFGHEATPVIALLVLMVLDGVTGVAKAARKRELSSRGFRRGAMKFFVYTILMSACAIADKLLPYPVAYTAMTAWLALTELGSILENIGELGWPIPQALLKTLKVMQQSKEGGS